MYRIFLPERFDQDGLCPFFEELDLIKNESEVVVDFSSLTYSYPSAMLVAGSKLRSWAVYRVRNKKVSMPFGIDPNKRVHSYLMHLGFFDFIYMDQGNRIGQARGSTRYLPITRIQIPPFDPSQSDIRTWHRGIADESRRLAGVLAGSHDDSEELRAYSYSIREVIRNVFEHSGAMECFICGQRWWNGKVEIAILDEGVGIANTLRQACHVESDEHALRLALMPGMSRTNQLSDAQNIFDNSGFGLYVLSSLAASFGWFALGSGVGRVIGYENTARQYDHFSFAGTFFGMQLARSPRDFRAILNEIIAEGEAESGALGIHRRASGFSRVAE